MDAPAVMFLRSCAMALNLRTQSRAVKAVGIGEEAGEICLVMLWHHLTTHFKHPYQMYLFRRRKIRNRNSLRAHARVAASIGECACAAVSNRWFVTPTLRKRHYRFGARSALVMGRTR